MRAVFANRQYRLLFAAIVTSMVGDWLMIMVLGVWVKELTDSNGAAGLTLLCAAVPSLLAPFGGLLVDRVRRRPFLIAANLANALFLVPLAFVDGPDDVWIVYGVAVLLGFGGIVDGPAVSGLLKRIVPAEQLVDANGARQVATQVLRLGGPLAGVAIYATFGGVTVAAVDAVSFVAAAGIVALMRVREERPSKPQTHFRDEVSAGFRFLLASPALRRAVTGMGLMVFAGGALEVLAYAITEGLDQPPEFVAVIVTTIGVTGILGGFLAPKAVRRFGELGTSGLAMTTVAVVMVLFAVPSTPAVLGGALLAGLVIPAIAVADTTLTQRLSPHELMGRVGAAMEVVTVAPQLLSLAAGAYLVTVVDHQVILVVMAAVMVLAGVYTYLGRRLSPPAERVSPSDRSSAAASRRSSPPR